MAEEEKYWQNKAQENNDGKNLWLKVKSYKKLMIALYLSLSKTCTSSPLNNRNNP